MAPSAAPAAAPLPLLPDLLSERVSPLRGRWFQRDLPYSWDFFMVRSLSTPCTCRQLQCVTLTNAVVACCSVVRTVRLVMAERVPLKGVCHVLP